MKKSKYKVPNLKVQIACPAIKEIFRWPIKWQTRKQMQNVRYKYVVETLSKQ